MKLEGKTKIVCTIGPASGSEEVIERLINLGMNVARLNLSHGTLEEHARYIRIIRNLAKKSGSPVAILADLPGPKLRAKTWQGREVELVEGENIVLTTSEVPQDERQISIGLPNLPWGIRVGEVVLLDDGAMQLSVRSITDTEVLSLVLVGGLLKPGKGIVIPKVTFPGPFLSQQDQHLLSFAVESGVDFIALSFVSKAEDVIEVREMLSKGGTYLPLIAKIERSEAVNHFGEILGLADGIMVARGDLGVEVPLEQLPLIQKEIIRKCNCAGKPVITATQMLESMTYSSSPTRAEITDVANAILDGSDAIMLSAETSTGKYPVQAMTMMSRIRSETEKALPYNHILVDRRTALSPQVDDAISYNACHTAHQLSAAAIVAFTKSGSTAQRVSKYRPKVPIVAITPCEPVYLSLALVWGVHPFVVPEPASVDELFACGIELVSQQGFAREGDLVVITAGIPIGVPGTTNLLKVERIG